MKNKLLSKWDSLSDESKLITLSGSVISLFVCFVFFINRDKFPRYYFPKLICELSFYSFIILIASFIVLTIKNKRCIKRKGFYIALVISLILSVPHIPILFGYSTTQIGDYYEKSTYKEKYMVIMSRDPESEPNRKAYTLPAEIERREDYVGAVEVGNGEYEDIETLSYHINYLYFSNGGYLSFDYYEAYENPEYCIVILNKERKVTDYKGNEYYVTLIDKKCK